MRHEAVAGYGTEVMSDRVRSLINPPPLNRFGRGVVELPLLVPGDEVAALEAAAHDRGLTVAQLARLLIRDFLGRTSGPDAPTALIRAGYGRLSFKTKEEFISF